MREKRERGSVVASVCVCVCVACRRLILDAAAAAAVAATVNFEVYRCNWACYCITMYEIPSTLGLYYAISRNILCHAEIL